MSENDEPISEETPQAPPPQEEEVIPQETRKSEPPSEPEPSKPEPQLSSNVEPMDIEAKWKADEEARKLQMGGEADPWDDDKSVRLSISQLETKEEQPVVKEAPVAIDLEEVQRKAREEAALQVAIADATRQEVEWEAQKKREAEEKEQEELIIQQRQRAALGDVGQSVDPDFLTSLIKAGLGFQGILELLKEMEVTQAKDLQAVKYQDLVDAGLKPIQARKLKAIGMRSNHSAEKPKQLNIKRTTSVNNGTTSANNSSSGGVGGAGGAGQTQRRSGSFTGGSGSFREGDEKVDKENGGKKKKKSMFKRLSSAFKPTNKHAESFAADFEDAEQGPTTDDLFEEGTQRYFKVERRVNSGEFTWQSLPSGLKKEMAEVRELWQQAADRGHPKAWHNLGYIYENGSGMVRDAKRAVECWTKAAEYGDMDAQYNLGVMYAKGRGVERNESKAVELLSLAADKGDANAQLNLGIMYAKGRGVEKDEGKAFILWEKSAEQGHASAQYNLGAMYATGRGIEKNLDRAVHLYHQAATQGVVQAQYSLGLMYQYGKSVEQNATTATELFTRAARQGHAKAQQHLDQLLAANASNEERNIDL
mmetsp:Transcript_10416/g.12653  ORF Transcript_10416/g.12653 Transcript_10416/m.12653 type:complete len:592 (-) Transcript_10416:172-1947(-)